MLERPVATLLTAAVLAGCAIAPTPDSSQSAERTRGQVTTAETQDPAPSIDAPIPATSATMLLSPSQSTNNSYQVPSVSEFFSLPVSEPIVAKSGQTITGLNISSSSGPCITVPEGVTDVTISGNDIGPCGTDVNGIGIAIETNATRINISGNVIHDVSSGVYVQDALNPIVIETNLVYDVRGPMPRGQMVQLNHVTGRTPRSAISGI